MLSLGMRRLCSGKVKGHLRVWFPSDMSAMFTGLHSNNLLYILIFHFREEEESEEEEEEETTENDESDGKKADEGAKQDYPMARYSVVKKNLMILISLCIM